MKFTKMHGLGNDYVYLDCIKEAPKDLNDLAKQVSDRHFGVGADGLICICSSETADFRMRMFNADGSEGEMCGNGIRCVGKFVYDKGLTDKTSGLTIETLGGTKVLDLRVKDGKVATVVVDMELPKVEEALALDIQGKIWRAIPVSMGNPHSVVFVDDVDSLDLPAIGPDFECHPAFPKRTNTEFVQVVDRTHLKMRVWERGSGETMACGTGACATVAAAASEGLVERHSIVHLLGGDLDILWSEEDGHIYMTGPAVISFEGELCEI